MVAEVPPNAVYVPSEAIRLSTPCHSDAEIQAEAKAALGPPPDAESSPPQTFLTPSHNIACAMSQDSVRCDIRNKEWTGPAKPADCHLDWNNSVEVTASEEGHVLCAGDTLFGVDYPILRYGRYLKSRAITCVSKSNGLTCTNKAGDGFFLSYEELKLF